MLERDAQQRERRRIRIILCQPNARAQVIPERASAVRHIVVLHVVNVAAD